MSEGLIGKGVPRIESFEKVTGTARFVGDMDLPGMLHGRMLLSPHAHARIVRIDTSKAESLDGVAAVLVGEELPYRLGLYMVDKPVLASGKVRHHGEVVAAVAAVSEEIAARAADLIEVTYEPLAAVFDPVEAVKPDAPLVHEDLHTYHTIKGVFFPRPHTNIANHARLRKGDVEEGFAAADAIVENEFSLPQVAHVPLETHRTVAHWKRNGAIEIWSSAQSPFAVRNLLSVALGMSHSRIRVVVPHVGGAFGGKAGIHLEPLVSLLSRKAGHRPVKLAATREEEFSTLPCRQGLVARIKTGVTKEGKITAQKIEYLWDAGAYADYGVNIGRAAGYSGAGPYDIDNVWIDSLTIYTNRPFGTAYRGFGHVEFFWAIERQMDMVAREIGMDSCDFRMRNLLRPGSVTITGEEITENTGSVEKCLEAVAAEVGWKERSSLGSGGNGKVRARGIAVLHKAPAMPSNTAISAILKFNEDATVDLMISGVDYGQGTATAFCQMTAEHLRIPMENVHFIWNKDTDRMPYDWQTVASRLTFMGGNAVIRAAEDCVSQLKDMASRALDVPVGDLEIQDGKVFVAREPARSIDYRALVMGYMFPSGNSIGGPVIGRGTCIAEGLTVLDPETGQGLPAANWTFGAHGVEIEIDTATGEIQVLKLASAFDVGRVINEALCRGQVVGGCLQGLGTALLETFIYNDEGCLINNSFTDYKIPTARDIPIETKEIFIETPQLNGPHGARGVAEHPMISIPSAVGNAIADALGVEIMELPLSPERVYLALKRKGNRD